MARTRNKATKGASQQTKAAAPAKRKNAAGGVHSAGSKRAKKGSQAKKNAKNPAAESPPEKEKSADEMKAQVAEDKATPKPDKDAAEKSLSPPATPTKNNGAATNASPPPQPQKKKTNPSAKNVNVLGPNTRMRSSRGSKRTKMQTGGAQNCMHCKKLCSYGHQCPSCKRTFHNTCMLSLNKSAGKMCIACFESSDATLKVLDSHVYDPYSPGNYIPFHPFTRRYAATQTKLDLVRVPGILT
jgi:hypothetical protein